MTKLTRRAFARNAIAVAAACGAGALAGANEAEGSKLAPGAQAEVEARMTAIVGRWGDRLTAEQQADIRRLITGAQAGFEQLRAYAIPNDVEPATLFRVYRREKRVLYPANDGRRS